MTEEQFEDAAVELAMRADLPADTIAAVFARVCEAFRDCGPARTAVDGGLSCPPLAEA